MNRKKIYVLIVVAIMLVGTIITYFTFTTKKYKVNETAKLDKFDVTLTNSSYSELNKELVLTFLIKNKNDYSITFNQDKFFKVYGISDFELYNTYQSNLNILKSNESTYYTLQYKVDKMNEYKVYFYPNDDNNKKVAFIVTQ